MQSPRIRLNPVAAALAAQSCLMAWSVVSVMSMMWPVVASAQTQAPATAAPADGEAAPETPYWRRAREGWFWQIDPVPEAKPKPNEVRPTAAQAPLSADERDLAALADFKARMERALNVATQNPTEANVRRYLELHTEARRKASLLADVGQALALRMPWIDKAASGDGRPTLPVAQRAFDSIKMQDRDQLLRDLAQTHGLYFFFRRNCAYCHLQGPMLRQFQEKYGFTVYAVTMDGGALPDFPNAVLNNGLAERVAESIGVPPEHFSVPAVVLARPSTREVVPIGFGAMTMDEMADRVASVVRLRDGAGGRAGRNVTAALVGADASGTAASSLPANAASQFFTGQRP